MYFQIRWALQESLSCVSKQQTLSAAVEVNLLIPYIVAVACSSNYMLMLCGFRVFGSPAHTNNKLWWKSQERTQCRSWKCMKTMVIELRALWTCSFQVHPTRTVVKNSVPRQKQRFQRAAHLYIMPLPFLSLEIMLSHSVYRVTDLFDRRKYANWPAILSGLM